MKLEIVPLEELLYKKSSDNELKIPPYQRPYRWKKESAMILLNDVLEASKKGYPEYRIGTVILHQKDGFFYIVDGQQRLTTLSILIYCICKQLEKEVKTEELSLLGEEYDSLSENAIIANRNYFRERCRDESVDLSQWLEYLKKNCTVVKIVTESEQEAFQFFDSQNSRGKDLYPHDLLKAYHLREMEQNIEKDSFDSIVSEWENTDKEILQNLFYLSLYPLVRWYKNQEGIYYTKDKIKVFKGISKENSYNFALYYKAINQRNNCGYCCTTNNKKTQNLLQLTQPLIAGKDFFEYTQHYLNLRKSIISSIDDALGKEATPEQRAGDKYVKNLFINISIFFADRFSEKELTKPRLRILYKWVYILRLGMERVFLESINKYAQGQHDINKGKNLFYLIADMYTPDELDVIELDGLDVIEKERLAKQEKKYPTIIKSLKDSKEEKYEPSTDSN